MTTITAPLTLERDYDASPEAVWELLGTPAGFERWWAPDGFEVQVSRCEVRVGGRLTYTMTATAPEQIAFVHELGLPLTNEFSKTFAEVIPHTRLAYTSVIDFVPGREPQERLTVIELAPTATGTALRMTLDPLCDEHWTREYCAHRAAELDKLGTLLTRAPAPAPRARA